MVHQAFRDLAAVEEETRAALSHTDTRPPTKSVCTAAPKYRSVLSASAVSSLKDSRRCCWFCFSFRAISTDSESKPNAKVCSFGLKTYKQGCAAKLTYKLFLFHSEVNFQIWVSFLKKKAFKKNKTSFYNTLQVKLSHNHPYLCNCPLLIKLYLHFKRVSSK